MAELDKGAIYSDRPILVLGGELVESSEIKALPGIHTTCMGFRHFVASRAFRLPIHFGLELREDTRWEEIVLDYSIELPEHN